MGGLGLQEKKKRNIQPFKNSLFFNNIPNHEKSHVGSVDTIS